MNRYPLWKYIMIAMVLIIAMVYTLPNFYGESPAVQVSSAKATVKVDEGVMKRVESALKAANLTPNGVFFEQGAQQNTVRVRFDPTAAEQQLKEYKTGSWVFIKCGGRLVDAMEDFQVVFHAEATLAA